MITSKGNGYSAAYAKKQIREKQWEVGGVLSSFSRLQGASFYVQSRLTHLLFS
jgi:hypothetical protein